jgi:hypothetical protein
LATNCDTLMNQREPKTRRDLLSNHTIPLPANSYMEEVCHIYNVQMNHPQDIDMFLRTVTKFRHEKGIAGNLFFGDIESDIKAKSDFIRKQSE